jgi:hypothetical protein
MAAANKVEIESVEESEQGLSPKNVTRTAIILVPLFHIGIGVGPEHVAEKTVFWDLCRASEVPKLVEIEQVRRDAAMDTKDLIIDDGGDWEPVENVGEYLPDATVVVADALVVEAEFPIYVGAFVVPSEQKEVFWVLNLVCEEKAHCIDALPSSIHVISEK